MKSLHLICLSLFTWLLVTGGAWAAAGPSEPERMLAMDQFLTSSAEDRWADALAPAQRLVALAREAGPRSRQLSEALTRVGSVQIRLGDFPGAQASFAEALAIIERENGPLDRELEEPLRGLGFSLASLDRHPEAIATLERALLVNQRRNGLFDLSQRDLRRVLGNSLSEMGRGIEAEQQYRTILQIAEQAYGPEDLRIVDSLNLVGNWYARWGHFEAGRQLYRRAVEIIGTKATPMDSRLVIPLRNIAQSYIRELIYTNAGQVWSQRDGTISKALRRNKMPQEGYDAVQRALQVIEAGELRNRPVYRGTLIDSGDWYMLKGDLPRAVDFYSRAFALPAATATDVAARGDPLAYPAVLDYAWPPVALRLGDRPEDKVIQRSVVVEFTVTRDGNVQDQHIVESDGTDRMERETLLAIRDALYRPRFENGMPVDTPNVRYQQTFRQLKN